MWLPILILVILLLLLVRNKEYFNQNQTIQSEYILDQIAIIQTIKLKKN